MGIILLLIAFERLVSAETPIEVLLNDAPGLILEIDFEEPQEWCQCGSFKVSAPRIKNHKITSDAQNTDISQDKSSLGSELNLYSSVYNDGKEFIPIAGTNLVLSVFKNLKHFECIAHLFLVWEQNDDKLILKAVLDRGTWVSIGYAKIDAVYSLDEEFGFLITGFSGGGDGSESWKSLWFAQWKGTRLMFLDQFHVGFPHPEKIERVESQIIGYSVDTQKMQAHILWRDRQINTAIGKWRPYSTVLNLPKFIISADQH